MRKRIAVAAASVSMVLAVAVPAFAAPVDPSTLQPVPPNAKCHTAGEQVICDTFADEFSVNEPILDFGLPCGTIYETFHFHGDGTRWYVGGLAVRRHVAGTGEGSWSLSPDGAGPTVDLSGHSSIWSTWTTPGDDSTLVELTTSGSDFMVSAPGYGMILHEAGRTYADGTHHGISPQIPFTPEVAATLCAALGA